MHRRHHELSDHDGRPAPRPARRDATRTPAEDALHAHLTWMAGHDYPNVAHYVPDLMQ